MTPKEKAKDILFAMHNAGKGIASEYLAKECALICVGYIKSVLPMDVDNIEGETQKVSYWNSVKEEIKKLK